MASELDAHVANIQDARSAHQAALSNPGQTVTVQTDDGPYDLPLALVTQSKLDKARSDAMEHIHADGHGPAYEAARDLAEDDPSDENRAAEQAAALELQNARQRVREAHGQAGHRVAGDAVRG